MSVTLSMFFVLLLTSCKDFFPNYLTCNIVRIKLWKSTNFTIAKCLFALVFAGLRKMSSCSKRCGLVKFFFSIGLGEKLNFTAGHFFKSAGSWPGQFWENFDCKVICYVIFSVFSDFFAIFDE